MAAPIPRVPPVTKATRPLSLSPARPAVFSFWVMSRTGVGEVMRQSSHARRTRAPPQRRADALRSEPRRFPISRHILANPHCGVKRRTIPLRAPAHLLRLGRGGGGFRHPGGGDQRAHRVLPAPPPDPLRVPLGERGPARGVPVAIP